MSDGELEFENIYHTFRPKIRRYLTRLVGEDEAEDLAQEVFVKVNQGLQTFRGEAQVSTWLYRIATNAALDRLRSPSFQQITQNGISSTPVENVDAEIVDRNAWTGEKVPVPEQQIVRKEMNECILGFME